MRWTFAHERIHTRFSSANTPMSFPSSPLRHPWLGLIAFFASAHGLLAQSTDITQTSIHTSNPVGGLIGLVVAVIMVASMWKIFTKAGEPGWASIIPFYNAYVMCKIAGKPGWWFVLLLIPLVNLIVAILIVAGVAKGFGKGVGYIFGMIFLPFIFYPLLAFGDATYQGPAR